MKIQNIDTCYDLFIGLLDETMEGHINGINIVLSEYGFKCIEQGGKYGIIRNGIDVLIPCEYDRILANYSNSGFYVCKDGKWGFISDERNVPCRYDSILVYVRRSGKCINGTVWIILVIKDGIIYRLDKNNALHPWPYSTCGDLIDGRALVANCDGYGYITGNFEEIIKCQYDYASDFNQGQAIVGHRVNRDCRQLFHIDVDGNKLPREKYKKGLYTAVNRISELQQCEKSYNDNIQLWNWDFE